MFQFPTGWNSTLSTGKLSRSCENCFNSQRDGILPAKATLKSSPFGCFNSQRDGILPFFKFSKTGLSKVSIPNGMEFYRCFATLIVKSPFVSIPNGMEFYASQRVHHIRGKTVSIPNGMEFYGVREFIAAGLEKFQFPTGWNSTQTCLS